MPTVTDKTLSKYIICKIVDDGEVCSNLLSVEREHNESVFETIEISIITIRDKKKQFLTK